MDIKNENDITKLKTEIERLQEVNKDYIKTNKYLQEQLNKEYTENKELKRRVIAYEVKANGINLKNNHEETISIYKTTEEIKETQENKANNEEYTGQKFENNRIAEMETMLKNSQYNWMKVEPVPEIDKWQIIDTRNGRVRFRERPRIVYETIKEITQNQ